MNKRVLTQVFFVLASVTFVAYGQSQSGQSQQDVNRTGSKTGSSHSQSKQEGRSNLDSSDRHFVMDAAEAGMSEVMMGQMAVQRASNDQVKQFAQRMIDDHTKANQELMQLASSKGVTLPQGGMTSSGQQMQDQSSVTSQSTQTGGQSDRTLGQQSGARTGQQTQSSDQTSGQMSRQSSQSSQTGMQTKGKDQAMMDRMSRLSGTDFDREYMRQQLKDHDKAVELFQKETDKGKDQELKAWASKTLPTLREHQQMARDIASTVGASDKSGSSSTKSSSSSSGKNNGQTGRP